VTPLLRSGITGKSETVVMPELANRPGPNFTDIRKDSHSSCRGVRTGDAPLSRGKGLGPGAGLPRSARPG